MKIGKNYKVKRMTFVQLETTKMDWGKCIWIHPKGRFAVLQFRDGIREWFKLLNGELVE